MGEVLDVRLSQLCSLPEAGFPSSVRTRDGCCNHIEFVQVRDASLAWARFSAGCDAPGYAHGFNKSRSDW